MATHWSQVQESGALLGMKFMLFTYRWFGSWLYRLFLYPVITYFFLRNRSARRASYHYLTRLKQLRAIPANSNLAWYSFRHFLQFGQNLGDKLAAWAGAFNYSNVGFSQREDFLQLVDQGQGALVIVSHLGNLEVCRALADESRRVKLNILVHTRHAEKFNQLLGELDDGHYLNLIQVTELSPATAIILQQKLTDGEVLVIAGDRTPVVGERQIKANFLGDPASFPQGPYILASVLRCPVYLMFCIKEARGYQIYFEQFAEKIRLSRTQRETQMQSWVQKFADRLTVYTLKAPLQWNNFYDFWQDDLK